MKTPKKRATPLLLATAIGGLFSLTLGACPLSAQEAPPSLATGEGLAPNFPTVSKHLNLGGTFYAFMDMEEDIDGLSTLLEGGLNDMAKLSPEFPQVDVKAVLKQLGIGGLKALGMSSVKQGTGFHNRAFLSMPGGPQGIFKLLGGTAAPFASAKLAPKGTDLIAEEQVSLNALLEVANDLLGSVKDESGKMASVKEGMAEALKQPAGPLPMSMGDLIKKMDLRYTLVARLDETKKIAVPDSTISIPQPHLIIALDNMDWLFPELVKMIQGSPDFAHAKEETREILKFLQPLPPPMDVYAPVVVLDKASKRVVVGTSLEFVQECLSAKTSVTEEASYKEAMKGLPTEGNGLSYISSKGIGTVRETVFSMMAEEAAKKNAPPIDLKKFMEFFLPKANSNMGSVRANLKDGILFASNSPDSHKSTLLTAAAAPTLLLAGFAPAAYGQLRGAPGRNEDPDLERLLRQAQEEGEGNLEQMKQDVKPSAKVKKNLQQIAFAAESFFLDDAAAKEVDYPTLVKRQFLYKLGAVSGEDYSSLKVKRAGGTLTVKLKDGSTVAHTYPAVTD